MTHDLPAPDMFTAGTVGPPGRRVFYLQAREEGSTITLRIEKQQVAALAEYLSGLLEDLPAAGPVPRAPDLVDPVVEAWTVGNIGVAYDNEHDRIVIVAEQLVAEDDGDGEQLRVSLTRTQVQSFIDRAEVLMRAGRPPCRICGMPIDPEGHICPREN